MRHAVLSNLTHLALAALLGLFLQPVLTWPAVRPIVEQAAQYVVSALSVIGVVLAAGYAHHRLLEWERIRPPALPPLEMTLHTTTHARAELYEAATLEHEAVRAVAEPLDREAAIRRALVEFAFVSRWGGFGWRAMCRYVGREDWTNALACMIGARVLEGPRGNKAAEWAGGWCYSRFRVEVKYGRLPLPFPADAPIPLVDWRKPPTVTH